MAATSSTTEMVGLLHDIVDNPWCVDFKHTHPSYWHHVNDNIYSTLTIDGWAYYGIYYAIVWALD